MAALVLLAIFSRPGFAQNIRLAPDILNIKVFFAGAALQVSGEIPAGTEAIIEVIGKEGEQELMRKGRRWDLWMNVGEIDITGVPGFYLIASSAPKLLLNPKGENPWGYGQWRRTATFRCNFQKGEEASIFEEFLALKEDLGLYGRFPGAVKLVPAGDSRYRVQATFPINTRIAPGTYQVRLAAVRDWQVVQRTSVPWQVDLVGIPAFHTYLAMKQPVLYGLLALGLAVAVGFLSGLLFKRR